MANKKYTIYMAFDVVSADESDDVVRAVKQAIKNVGKKVLVQDVKTTTWIDPIQTTEQLFDDEGKRIVEDEAAMEP